MGGSRALGGAESEAKILEHSSCVASLHWGLTSQAHNLDLIIRFHSQIELRNNLKWSEIFHAVLITM